MAVDPDAETLINTTITSHETAVATPHLTTTVVTATATAEANAAVAAHEVGHVTRAEYDDLLARIVALETA